uniref:Ig-like domain-containing protein n=1 Tax=Otus sunia TaxID=257818 RepID=A0A8C8B3X0_9STRI
MFFYKFSFSILPAAFLDLTGPSEIKGVWKGSTTLPCAYVPVEDVVQQTLRWTVVHDQSSGTVFWRDASGDHVLLSEYRGRVSVPKDTPGNVSLHILNLEISDRGTYACQVTWRTLGRRAGGICGLSTVGPWLHLYPPAQCFPGTRTRGAVAGLLHCFSLTTPHRHVPHLPGPGQW